MREDDAAMLERYAHDYAQQSEVDAAARASAQQLQNFYGGNVPAEGESSREFYMSYEDDLKYLVWIWKGYMLLNDEWVIPDGKKPTPMISDTCIKSVTGFIRSYLTNAARLANHTPEDVRRYAYEARVEMADLIYKRSVYYENIDHTTRSMIVAQVSQLIHSALTWSSNAGGQRFMTRSIISHENVSQIIAGRQKGQEEYDRVSPKNKLW